MDVALSVLTRPTSTDGAENCPSKGDRLPIPRALNSRYALETKKALSGKAAGLPCSTHRAICTRGRNRTCAAETFWCPGIATNNNHSGKYVYSRKKGKAA